MHHEKSVGYHWGSKGVSTSTTVEEARDLARRLEKREWHRSGEEMPIVRAKLARSIGVAPTTWRNLALGRLKRLDAWMRDRLQGLLIRELEAEILRLSHDLDVARQSGARVGGEQVIEIETMLARCKALLNGEGV